MESELKQWRARIDFRNNAAQREKDRRERILAEVRQNVVPPFGFFFFT